MRRSHAGSDCMATFIIMTGILSVITIIAATVNMPQQPVKPRLHDEASSSSQPHRVNRPLVTLTDTHDTQGTKQD